MLVVGLFSSKDEVEEMKHIAKICDLEGRIHFVVRMQKLKELLKREN
ncbi:MAG: hypothetical protein U9O49_04165 [Candidatus Thermoplasmatota archaeon]|nr:hypothetical protein [Candidatus Thermoplasmatota archaeon]